ncbi:hypothetical protein F4604DRAFT_1923535 [Suillus subluteus]|nr:hypothetical protein F4604DRAFT_1923535 [Suillus subluteus]
MPGNRPTHCALRFPCISPGFALTQDLPQSHQLPSPPQSPPPPDFLPPPLDFLPPPPDILPP